MPTWHKVTRPQPKRDNSAYNNPVWKRIRRRHLAANPACVACGKAATTVDHIDGDAYHNAATNLQSMCRSCHAKKSWLADGALGRGRRRKDDPERRVPPPL